MPLLPLVSFFGQLKKFPGNFNSIDDDDQFDQIDDSDLSQSEAGNDIPSPGCQCNILKRRQNRITLLTMAEGSPWVLMNARPESEMKYPLLYILVLQQPRTTPSPPSARSSMSMVQNTRITPFQTSRTTVSVRNDRKELIKPPK